MDINYPKQTNKYCNSIIQDIVDSFEDYNVSDLYEISINIRGKIIYEKLL